MLTNFPLNTFAGLLAAPQFEAMDISDVPVKGHLATGINNMCGSGGSESPTRRAVEFYLYAHVISELRKKYGEYAPLPEPVIKITREYLRVTATEMARMMYYVLVICGRECRHSTDNMQHGAAKALISKHGFKDAKATTLTGKFNTFSTWQQIGDHFPPETTVGEYTLATIQIFSQKGWSSSYGGPKWRYIAECLYKMVTGEWSPEIFYDTAFTLAHNTAPIFNKGFLYSSADGDLIKVLDVQRSGQIPHYVLSGNGMKTTEATKKMLAFLQEHEPLMFGPTPEVDWDKVNDLGAVGHYSSNKKSGKSSSKPQPLAAVKLFANHTVMVHTRKG